MIRKRIHKYKILKAGTLQSEAKSLPLDRYRSAVYQREKRSKVLLTALAVLEIGFVTLIGLQIKENRIISRILKEFEMQSTGYLYTENGIYEGETDFGAFVGEGQFVSNTGAT